MIKEIYKMSEFVTPTQSSELRKGGYICIDDKPCKIVDIIDSKTGKHGGRKMHFTALDIFTNQKREYLSMSTQNVNVPNVSKNDYQVVDIEDDVISYLDDNDEIQSDLNMPKLCKEDTELSKNIKITFDNKKDEQEIYITVISAMGQVAVKDFRIK
jgi:translation initiation factor 5A